MVIKPEMLRPLVELRTLRILLSGSIGSYNTASYIERPSISAGTIVKGILLELILGYMKRGPDSIAGLIWSDLGKGVLRELKLMQKCPELPRSIYCFIVPIVVMSYVHQVAEMEGDLHSNTREIATWKSPEQVRRSGQTRSLRPSVG